MAAGGGDPWKISGEDRAKHDAQFFSLKPVNGFITGAQARDFFMQSGLSTQILGQIWTLADMNGDGKMDKLEFSVAMHLIKKKLQGYELPKVLPASLKVAPSPVIGSFGMQAGPMAMGQPVVMGIAPAMNPPMGMPMSGGMMPQASLGTSTMTTGSVGMPLMANGIGPAQGMQGMGMGIPPAQPASGAGTGWAMPHPSKLKYTQLFNTHDRNKRGFLTGVEARGILMQSGLPQPVLAQIWMLSDVDSDGKLTCDEFCIAMHLSDMARLGRALPPKLPAELMPSKARAGSFGPGTGGIAGAMPAGSLPPSQTAAPQKESFGDLLGSLGMPQTAQAQLAQAAPGTEEAPPEDTSPATFEDKRKENFDKGQAELERRRALLREQMKAEENTRLEKERREAEKRERIRLEQEARRQEELQRQLEKQRKIEMERDEQRRKMMEQREQARRELERQHQMEWERQRKEQLMMEKQREYEQLTTLKSQNTNLKGQLESLDGKKAELAMKISQVRNGVTDLTSGIESMRIQRDTMIAEIDRSEREATELNQKLSRLNGEKEQLQTQLQTQQNTPLSDAHRTVMHSVELKRTNLQKLRRELEQLEQETETKLADIDNGNIQVKSLQSLVEQLQREIPALQKKQQEARALQHKQEADKTSRDRQRQEQVRRELEAQRKKEEAEKAKASVNGSSTKADSWFDFNSGAAGSAVQESGSASDAWSSVFSTPAAATTATATAGVWGASDPFAKQPLGGAGVKKTRYKVLFPFESRCEDELTINPGDEVLVWDVPSEPGMEEWFKGEANGMVGWFPQAYAEPIPEPAVPSIFSSHADSSDAFGSAFQPVQASPSQASPQPPATNTSVTPGAPPAAGIASVKAGTPPVAESAFQPTPGEAHKAPEGLKAEALYQWKARQDNHLSFNKGDIILVKEQEDLWWMGELGGKVGWFPKAYVKLLETEKATLSSSQTSSPMGTLEKNGSASASPAPERKDGEYYVAMYSYVSGEPTDLNFNEGDMIMVTKKDEDWWTGTLGDKTGIFPSSYVKKVEIQTPGTTSMSHHSGDFASLLAASDFGGGVVPGVSFDEVTVSEGSSSGTCGQKPVAPPRRVRSKKGSECEASLDQPGEMDVGPRLAFSSASSASDVAMAPPSPNRSKKGSESEGETRKAASVSQESGSGMLDFGASFADAISSGPQSSPAKVVAPPRRSRSKKGSDSEGAATKPASAGPDRGSGMFDFEVDFSNAFPPHVAEEMPTQLAEVDVKGSTPMLDFGDATSAAVGSTAAVERGDTSQAVGELASNPAGVFDFGAGFPAVFPAPLPGQEGGHHPFLSSTASTQSLEVDFNQAFPPQDPAAGADFNGAFPSLPQLVNDDSPDPFSLDADQAFTSSEPTSREVSFMGSDSFSEPPAVASANSSSQFDLSVGGLMSANTPVPASESLESVKPTGHQPPTGRDSPAVATFYLGESSMSTHSSAAELTAIASQEGDASVEKSDPVGEKSDPVGEKSDPVGEKSDPFADLFSTQTSSGVVSPLPPPSCLLKGANGSLEPAELPPPAPPISTSVGEGGVGLMAPDILPSTTLFAGFENEQWKASAESDEPGQKSAKKPEIAMVIAPYAATGNGQLSLEPGNLIHVRQKSPRGWWEGELQARGQRKKIGWFPANYVKLLGSSSARSTPDSSVTLSAGQQQAGGSRSSTPQPQPTAPAPSLPPASAERLVALYAYTAQNEDELTFEKDAIITVLSRDNPDWWQGEVNGQMGLFPSNYVTPMSAAHQSWLSDSVRHKLTGAEKQRQNYIQELITTEEIYNEDMSIVLETFHDPLMEAGVLTEQEAQHIFVNWNDLIICNKKFLQALRVRKKMCGKGKVIFMIGDILCENLPHMTPYVRFCSCQLTAAALLQRKTENSPEFVEVHKKCVANPKAKGMPMSSFLLKPMQRITKYPLLIKEILKHTPADHADYGNLEDALQRAEELCNQVNEGVREKENSDRLEWIQRHVHCDGLAENITFNSVTNCLGSRKLVHCGVLYKVKSNKELYAFLFNDFLLLTVPPRLLGPSVSASHIFDAKSKDQFKMYKTPIVLNEVMVKKHSEPEADPCQFQVSHIERVYHLRAPNESERDLWVKRIEATSRQFLDTDRKKRERAHSLKCKPVGRLLVIIEEGIRLRSTTESARRVPGVGRLLVVLLEGCDLRACDSSGKSDPYCEVSMGSQEHRTRVMTNTLNPKWNASMQFTIRDLHQDVLCITVYDRDLYSPNDFLGRTEVRMNEVLEEAKVKKGPITKRLILHEVDTGEVIVKLDLQLYES